MPVLNNLDTLGVHFIPYFSQLISIAPANILTHMTLDTCIIFSCSM